MSGLVANADENVLFFFFFIIGGWFATYTRSVDEPASVTDNTRK